MMHCLLEKEQMKHQSCYWFERMMMEEETNLEDTKDQVCSIYQRVEEDVVVEVMLHSLHHSEDLKLLMAASCKEEEELQSIDLVMQGIEH
jgi:hypothetical protein